MYDQPLGQISPPCCVSSRGLFTCLFLLLILIDGAVMVMDCRRLRFPGGTFDLVIDKGVLDCVICGLNGTVDARKMMSQVHNALKPGGIYSVMSCGSPSKRLDLIQSVPVRWSKVEYTSIHAKRGRSEQIHSPPGSPSSSSKGRIYYYHCVK